MTCSILLYLMTFLPAIEGRHGAPLRRYSPVSWSLFHRVHGFDWREQTHPEIHNTNYSTLRVLETQRDTVATHMLVCLNRQCIQIYLPVILTQPLLRSPLLSKAPLRDICPLPCVTNLTPPNAWWSSTLTLDPWPPSLPRSWVVRA